LEDEWLASRLKEQNPTKAEKQISELMVLK